MTDISILIPSTSSKSNTLKNLILISLFTDKRATEDETSEEDRRGYWGDDLGSKLWLLEREKQSPSVITRAEQYSEEALEWLVQDGIIDSIYVTARFDNYKLIITISPLGYEIDASTKSISRPAI